MKILHDQNRTSRQYVERFKSEALLASKLDHPNVTRILDCGEESDGRLSLAKVADRKADGTYTVDFDDGAKGEAKLSDLPMIAR